jgi:TonB family protein
VGPFHLDTVAQLNQAQGNREIVRRSEPAYPLIACRARLTGKVRLRVKVAADGGVASIVVLGGNPFFVKAGLEAAAKWRWKRATGDTEEFVLLTFENP